jgi:hypothetical protein
VLCIRAVSYARFLARFNARPTLRVNSLFLIGTDLFFKANAPVTRALRRNYRKPPINPLKADRPFENSTNFDRIVSTHLPLECHIRRDERAPRYALTRAAATQVVSIRFYPVPRISELNETRPITLPAQRRFKCKIGHRVR